MTRFDDATPLGRLDWRAVPVAPPANEKIGRPLTFGPARRAAGRVTLRRRFHLLHGHPTDLGQFAVRADALPEAAVTANGAALPLTYDPALAAWRGDVFTPLVAGENLVELAVAAGRFAAALRLHRLDAEGAVVVEDFHDWEIDGDTVAADDEDFAAADADGLFDRPRRSFDFRREFEVSGEVRRATLSVVGPALHEVRVNGQPVTDAVLQPGWTDFRKRLTRCAYDVADLLAAGGNRIDVTLGNGWYTSGLGPEQRGRFGGPDARLWFMAELTIELADGGTTIVGTGDGWRCRPSATAADSLYDGEQFDPAAAGAWRDVAVLDLDGELADLKIAPSPAPPIRETGRLAAQSVTRVGPGRFVFDFGQNHAGACELRPAGLPAGTALTLRHAEILGDDGRPYVGNLRTARATDGYVTAGEDGEAWTPRFTYHGFRYAELGGLPDGFEPPASMLASRVLHTDVEPIGEFECSSALLNRLWETARWGLRSNLHSVFTDCPQRDERLGWTGDVQIVAELACGHFDVQGPMRKYLLDVIDAQLPDGRVPHVAPHLASVVGSDASMAWADVICVLPWTLWRHYGDRAALEVAWPAARKWLAYLESREEDGQCGVGTFGDWVPVVQTPAPLVAQAWSSWAARLGARIARVLGENDEAARHDAAADRRAARLHADWFDEAAGAYRPGTQTAQVLPLAFGIVPGPHRAAVGRALAARVEADGGKITGGFCGAPHLLPVLSAIGRDDLAAGVLLAEDYPSLGYMLAKGATTVWERWDTDVQPPLMNSRNHFAYGSLTTWLVDGLAGLRPDGARPGWGGAIFRPAIVGGVTHATAARRTRAGTFRVAWHVDGDELTIDAEVPDGAAATCHWPGRDTPRAEGVDRAGKNVFTWQGGRRTFAGLA